MLTPKVERIPPVTVEFLRIVCGVEAVRLQCGGCKAVQVASWADLDLPDDAHFPPAGTTWKCGMCGGTDITATPELPVSLMPESGASVEVTNAPKSPSILTDDHGAISPDLRDRLQAVMDRFGKTGK